MLKEQVAEGIDKLLWEVLSTAVTIEVRKSPRAEVDRYITQTRQQIHNLFKAEVDKLTVIDTIKIHDKTGIDITNSGDWERIKRILEAQLQADKDKLLDLMGE